MYEYSPRLFSQQPAAILIVHTPIFIILLSLPPKMTYSMHITSNTNSSTDPRFLFKSSDKSFPPFDAFQIFTSYVACNIIVVGGCWWFNISTTSWLLQKLLRPIKSDGRSSFSQNCRGCPIFRTKPDHMVGYSMIPLYQMNYPSLLAPFYLNLHCGPQMLPICTIRHGIWIIVITPVLGNQMKRVFWPFGTRLNQSWYEHASTVGICIWSICLCLQQLNLLLAMDGCGDSPFIEKIHVRTN